MFRLAAIVLLVVSAGSALHSAKIIGEEASIEEFPSQASFFVDGLLICSASILSEKVVLTNSHCILNMNSPEDCNVRVGSALSDEGGQFINVEHIYQHDNYSKWTYDYDIALVTLRTPIVFDGITVAPIKFAQSGEPQRGGVVGLVAGWETGGEGHKILRKESLTVAGHEKCVEVYSGTRGVTERMLCVLANGEKGTCIRRDGGALIVDGVLVGIRMFPFWDECRKPENPSVFIDISIVSDWIVKTLASIG